MNIVKGLAGPLTAVAVGVAHAHASDIKAFTEFEGRWQSEQSLGALGIMLPLQLDATRTFFVDLNGSFVEAGIRQASLGAGYRFGTGSDWLFGLYGYYDYQQSRLGNDFHQLSLGAEALGPVFETRANIYLPLGDGAAVGNAGQGVISDGVLKFREIRERARPGVDAEAGFKVPGLPDDTQLKLFAGSYWYGGRNISDMFGAKLRAELAFANVAGLPQGSTVSFGASATYDNEERFGGAVMARLRIPLGASGNATGEAFDPATQAVRRVSGIRTHVGATGDLEDAIYDRTGQTAGKTVMISSTSGDAAALNAMLQSAGYGALILADGSIGLDGSLALQAGQTLLGGGGTLALRGASSGARGTFTNTGAATTLTGYNPAQDVLTMASNSVVSSLAITGGLAGIGSTDTAGLTIDNVDISQTGYDGIRLTRVNGALIENSAIHDLYICNDNTLCEFSITDLNRAPYAAVKAHGTTDLTIRDTTFANVTYGLFGGSVIDESGSPPKITDLTSKITLENVHIANVRREGILLVAAKDVALNKVTVDNSAVNSDKHKSWEMDLVVLQGSSNVRITDMSLKGGINGLMLVTSTTLPKEAVTTDVKIDGLRIDGTSRAGIFINPVAGIDLKNVTITNAGTHGINFYSPGWPSSVKNISFDNVLIDKATLSGLEFLGQVEDFTGSIDIRNTPRDCSSIYGWGDIAQSSGSVFIVNGQELGTGNFVARCM